MMEAFNFEAKLGSTRYTLERDRTSIKLTRYNEKVTTVWFPEALLIEYAKAWVRDRFAAIIAQVK